MDLCILCGCDYTGTISGIGPVKAYKYIQEYSCIEKVLKQVEREIANQATGKKAKYIIPEEFAFVEARKLFLKDDYPGELEKVQEVLKWQKPNEEELKEFLIT